MESPVPPAGGPVAVARLGRPHGLAGELSATPMWDGDPSPLVGLALRVEGESGPRRAISIRRNGARWILGLSGVEGPESARELTNRLLLADPADLPRSAEAAPYHFELIGMSVVDGAGRELGTVRRIDEAPSGDLLVLDDEGLLLIPFRPMVVKIDRVLRRVFVDLPEGLLEVNRPRAR